MRHFVGTSGYSYPAWKGSFYPDKWPAKKMLSYYAERFAAVEIDSTYYRMPKAETLATWQQEVPAPFIFSLKAAQRITHSKKLIDCADDVGYFWKAAETLNQHLGPVLFQLPPYLPVDCERLAGFLAVLPAAMRVTFEFRHDSWFIDDVYERLAAHGAALCVAESEKIVTPLVATTDFGYLRLRTVDYNEQSLANWAKRIQQQKWSECFVFFKHEDGATGPRFAHRLNQLLSHG